MVGNRSSVNVAHKSPFDNEELVREVLASIFDGRDVAATEAIRQDAPKR